MQTPAWYDSAFEACVAAGVMNGTSDTTMSPEAASTRETIFVMFGRAIGIEPAAALDADKQFSDSDKLSSWAQGIVYALVNKDYVKGIDGSLEPDTNINRASLVSLIDQTVAERITENGTYNVKDDGVVIVLAKDATINGSGDMTIVATQPNTEISLKGATGNVEVIAQANNIAINDAPIGTTIKAGDGVTGTTANGDKIAADSETTIPEKQPASGNTGSTPSAPPACQHTGTVTTSTAATCLDTGSKTFVCDICGNTITQVISALGHDYESVQTPATCTSQGFTTYTCRRDICDSSYVGDYVNMLPHSWNSGEEVTAPGCGVYTRYTCTLGCGVTKDEATGEVNHTWDSWSPSGSAIHARACSTCQEKQTANCTYGEWTNATPAACETAGERIKTCTCSNSITEPIAALGHNYAKGETTAPTCTQQGFTTYVCQNDNNHTEQRDYVDATGHSWNAAIKDSETQHKIICNKCGEFTLESHILDDGIITTPSTCTVAGVKTYNCTVADCDYTSKEAVNLKAHEYNTPVQIKNDNEKHTFVCDACGDNKTDKTAQHNYGNWSYAGTEGTRACSDCGYVQKKTVVARVENGDYYETLDAAIEAVSDGGRIVLLNDGVELLATATAINKSFNIKPMNPESTDFKAIKNPDEFWMAADEAVVIEYAPLNKLIEGKGENYFGIGSIEGLLDFATKVNTSNSAFSNQTVKLTQDIDLSGVDWEPIGQTGSTEFLGVLDGNGKTIRNLTIDTTNDEDIVANKELATGFFGWLTAGTVKNLIIEDADVKGVRRVGAIAGYLQLGATIENCTVTGVTISGIHIGQSDDTDTCGDKVGGVVGYMNSDCAVKNCTVSNAAISAGRDAGCVVGAGHTSKVTGCTFSAVTVESSETVDGHVACRGGFINTTFIGRDFEKK